MKINFKIGALALGLLSFALAANAQTANTENNADKAAIRLSVGPEFGITAGNFSDAYDWNFGGSVQADFPVIQKDLYVTVNAGFNNFYAKDLPGLTDLQLIPVKAGLKYFPVQNFYVQGEAGASFLANKSDLGADNSAAFVYAPQVGVLFNVSDKSYIDAGIRFEGNSKFNDGGKASNFFGVRVAYSFDL